MSKLLILCSTLNQDVVELVEKAKFSSDVLIVNQCDEESSYVLDYPNFKVYVYETKERGLSKSRNFALNRAQSLAYDIYLFTDDDVEFVEGYEEVILQAYEDKKDADFIAFDYFTLPSEKARAEDTQSKNKGKLTRVRRKHHYYASVRITVKKLFIADHAIRFNERFGTGSGVYSHGEDSLFVRDCKSAGAVIYESTYKIAKVDFSVSTWRNISNQKFFSDKGFLWRELAPKTFFLWGIPLVFKLSFEYKENFFKAYYYFLNIKI